MGIFEAVVQGIVQGLTEFLPVSSSGHLLLSQHILGVKENNLFFDVMLHLGTLIAVLAVYYKLVIKLIVAFFEIIKDIFTGNFRWNNLKDEKRMVVMLIIGLMPLFLLFLPIPGTGSNIKDLAEKLSNQSSIILVGISLLITSILLSVGISKTKNGVGKYSKHSYKKQGKKSFNVLDSICVGFTQCIAAIFPGISRSGSTLSVGLMRGIDRQAALDYSFILGIPSIMAAALLELKEFSESSAGTNIEIMPIIIGIIVSAVVGFMAIVLFKWLLATDKMNIFVIYTLVVGTLSVIIGIIEMINGVNVFTGIPL